MNRPQSNSKKIPKPQPKRKKEDFDEPKLGGWDEEIEDPLIDKIEKNLE